MAERPQEHDFVRASINQDREGISGIHLPVDRPLLGKGGQGWVFYAEEADGTPRALKVHRALEGMSAEEAARSAAAFENEGECLQQFDHPNIIKVFRTGIHERTVSASNGADGLEHVKEYRYMLMEYAELGSVADRIKNRLSRNIGLLPVEEAVLCIVHATEGMRYAHGETGDLPHEVHRMTHGDLNPRNLVIAAADGRDRVVKVADFGIARRGHSGVETMTSTQFHAFSEAYASPNQIRTGNVFFGDDVYSLGGVTAYELLNGIRPFDPEHKTLFGYLSAHETADVPPMERMNGERIDQVVEALNEPVLTALNRNPYDPNHTYSTMGAYQAAFNEALAKGTARAAKEQTIIILSKKKDTLPLSAPELLGAELPPEEDTYSLTLADKTVSSSDETEVAGEFPSDTRPSSTEKNTGVSRRRFIEAGAGLLAAGMVGGGAFWLNEKRRADEERRKKEQEKLNQESAAIVAFGYKIVDLLANISYGDDEPDSEITVPTLLDHILPNDPEGIVPWIEKLQDVRDSNYHIRLLTARLAYYNPEAALKIMNAKLDKKDHRAAMVIAMQFASLAQAPDGPTTRWRTEAEKVRSAIAGTTTIGKTDRAGYDKALAAAFDAASESAARTLNDFLRNNYYSIEGRALALAMARHNPDAVAREMSNLVDTIKTMPASAKANWHTADSYYGGIELTCRELARYVPDKITEIVGQIKKDNTGTAFSNRAETAVLRLLAQLAPHNPNPVKDYVKNGSDNPSDWSSDRWRSTAVVALGSTDPAMVAAHNTAANYSPFGQFMRASLDPLNTNLTNEAFDALKDSNYLKNYGRDLMAALLASRQAKI